MRGAEGQGTKEREGCGKDQLYERINKKKNEKERKSSAEGVTAMVIGTLDKIGKGRGKFASLLYYLQLCNDLNLSTLIFVK